MVIASECVAAGYVLRHRTFPGNTNDQTIAKVLVASLPELDDETQRAWVSDAGMMSKGLMGVLDGAGWHRLSAEGPRKSVLGLSVLQDVKGRFTTHSDKPHMGYKAGTFTSEMTDSGRAEMVIASTYSPKGGNGDRPGLFSRYQAISDECRGGSRRLKQAQDAQPEAQAFIAACCDLKDSGVRVAPGVRMASSATAVK